MALNYYDIEAAVNSETNAGGFAELMQKFKTLGVIRYDYLVAEGIYRYFDLNTHVDLAMSGVPKPVAKISSIEKIKAAVHGAQAGEFDFEHFCELAGEAGVPVWQTNLISKHVTYYGNQNKPLLIEPIPGL
ncbi:DUF1398 family protein [Lentilactobacillus kosonis]|uniref:Phage envelope protein n=1 Tax=Lentilactobacillus kosonis TaxID=2810561 RepID=A0A401FMK0_9LACO|nr:DUF1398 family protein [Lentilactobacillus kosonis]GAY73567.1 hypothetical protein NBRC111893_1713 [Lentilactobacillus kosonis]